MTEKSHSIAIVQYAGDYGEAYTRLASGGSETYYAQRYSIDAVADLLRYAEQVTTICCTGPVETDSILPNGVRAIALAGPSDVDENRVIRALVASKVTHLCLRTPLTGVLRYALRNPSVESVLLTLADSFNGTGARAAVRHWRFARWLNHPKVAAIGNHGMSSSRSLERIGVDPHRIIPWDWPHEITPAAHEPKVSPGAGHRWRLLFVGIMSESKGFGDCLEAVALLLQRGFDVALEYAGTGNLEDYTGRVAALNLGSNTSYLGKIPHDTVVPRMREADIVIVPSRHDYPEGFPMTLYEALSSRTPIVASDHPMYAGHLARHAAAQIYPAGNPAALADAIAALMADTRLYASLSIASRAAWEALQLPVSWGDLVHDWAENTTERPLRNLRYALAVTDSAAGRAGSTSLKQGA